MNAVAAVAASRAAEARPCRSAAWWSRSRSWWRLPGLLRGARHVVIPDGPHAIIWTHADEVNQALLDFTGAQPGDDGV
jgi:pimeloyl-ACP methyl ester carboxylesterase